MTLDLRLEVSKEMGLWDSVYRSIRSLVSVLTSWTDRILGYDLVGSITRFFRSWRLQGDCIREHAALGLSLCRQVCDYISFRFTRW